MNARQRRYWYRFSVKRHQRLRDALEAVWARNGTDAVLERKIYGRGGTLARYKPPNGADFWSARPLDNEDYYSRRSLRRVKTP